MAFREKNIRIFSNEDTITGIVPDLEGYHFGLIDLELEAVAITKKPHLLYFTIDGSGSMDDKDRAGKSKMDYVHMTLKNILRYVTKQQRLGSDVTIYICVDAFDADIIHVIEPTLITMDNETTLIDKIYSIQPGDSTNIEIALDNAKQRIETYHFQNPNHKIFHIMLTDGEANVGEQDIDILKTKIGRESNARQIFIGIGDEHNAIMLKGFSNHANSEYRFIDDGENCGIVYGEMLHSILYPAMENVAITIEHAELYDWKTNTWSSFLKETSYDSECKKTYHIRTKTPYMIITKIIGLCNDQYNTEETILYLHGMHAITPIDDMRFMKYLYRQRVLEMLYCHQPENREDGGDDVISDDLILNGLRDQIANFMNTYHLNDDAFMKTLCQDIYILRQTKNRSYATMYCSARQQSQGRQDSFTPRYRRRTSMHNPPPLRRCPRICTPSHFSSTTLSPDDFDALDFYENDEQNDLLNLTPSRSQMINEISQSTD